MNKLSAQNKSRLVKAIAVLALAGLVLGVMLWPSNTPTVVPQSPSGELDPTDPTDPDAGTTDPELAAETAPELWTRALAGELGPVEEVVALMNDPANSDLEPGDFTAASETATRVLDAHATGKGTEAWPEYFTPSLAPLGSTEPPLLCSAVEVRAANARAWPAAAAGRFAQVLVLYNGTCPRPGAADRSAPLFEVVYLAGAPDGSWSPVRPDVVAPTPDPASDPSIAGRRFPVAGPCQLEDDYAASSPEGTTEAGAVSIPSPAGTPVIAIERGQIDSVGYSPALGSFVALRGDSGSLWVYSSLDQVAAPVYVGAALEAGEQLGTVGTGPDDPSPRLVLSQTPGAGATVNPFALLVALAARDKAPCAPAG